MAGWRDEAIPVETPPARDWRSQAIPLEPPQRARPAPGRIEPALTPAERNAVLSMTPPPARAPIPAAERKIVGTFFDNGVIYMNPDGTLSARNDGMVTNNQETIRGLMEGRTPAQSWQTEIDMARINQNPVAARSAEVLNSVPFIGSRADEAVGMFSTDARDNMRRTSEAMQRQFPGQTTALNVTGAIAGAIPMAVAAAGSVPTAVAQAPRWGRALLAALGGAVTGATEGAIYGSGEGETPEQRRENAISGAKTGGAGGAILGPLAVYGGDATRAVLQRLFNSDVSQVATGLGISTAAARELKNAIGSGDIATAEEMLRRAGPDAMLGEAGIPMRAVMDATAQSGGEASRIVNDAMGARMASATQQVTGALDATLGMPRGVVDLVDDIRSGRGQPGFTPNVPALVGETRGPGQIQRSALYNEAYRTPIDYSDPRAFRLDSLLRRVPAAALRRADEIMDIDGQTSAQVLLRVNDDGTTTRETMPDVRQIHYIMQALDDIAAGTDGTGTFGRQNTYGSKVEQLRGDISRTLRGLVEPFAVAQDAAADTARQIRAVEVGRKITSLPTAEFRAELRNLPSQAEREAARDGVRSYIDELMEQVTRNAGNPTSETEEALKALNALGDTRARVNLRVLLGQESADTLLDQLDRAHTAFELRVALAKGSQTAIRTSLQTGIRESANAGPLRALAAGEPVRFAQRLTQALTGETVEARRLREQGLFQEIATALTETQGDRARTALRMINLAMRGQPLRDQQARLVADALAGSTILQSRPTATYAQERLQGSQ